MMEYNTQRPYLIIPEYGRHIQKMVDHAVSIKDSEERNKTAKAIINGSTYLRLGTAILGERNAK